MLMQGEPEQVVSEGIGISHRAIGVRPSGDGVAHSCDELPHTVFAFRCVDMSLEIAAGHHSQGAVRPADRGLYIVLGKNRNSVCTQDFDPST